VPTETVVKSKSTKTCRNCKSNLAGSATKCQNCGSSDLAKSLIIIRKSEMTGEDANAPDPTDAHEEVTEHESGDDEELEDLEEDDFEPAEGDEDDDEDDEEEDSEDDDAEEDEDDEEDPKVTKRIVRRRRVAKSANTDSVNLDILMAALTVAEDISEAVAKNDVGEDGAYDRAMHAFNNVCDGAVALWGNGESISKADDSEKLKRLKARVAEIRAKLKGSDSEDDDDEDNVEKSEDIFKGLSPAAAAILREAQSTLEEKKVNEFQTVAKSFGPLPTSEVDLGAALRVLADADKTAYETVTKALKAAAESQRQSDIFKSFGSAQAGFAASGGDELGTIAKSLMASNNNLTEEQAYSQALHQNPQLYDDYIAKSAVSR
jgi:RNA polymerase subunit RPABC4/transcription elongation factor Spt4